MIYIFHSNSTQKYIGYIFYAYNVENDLRVNAHHRVDGRIDKAMPNNL